MKEPRILGSRLSESLTDPLLDMDPHLAQGRLEQLVSL